VIERLNAKLIRRHPLVFGDEAAAAAGNRAQVDSAVETAGEVLRNWEQIKAAEKAGEQKEESLLDAVPRTLPALAEAAKLGAKAAKVHFDWSSHEGLFDKLAEEMQELKAELVQAPDEDAVAEELGDLLFTAANLARHLKQDPEMALRKANLKFRRRFGAMEAASSKPLGDLSNEELETLWKDAKRSEKSR
jgi:MazG family protein